MMRTLVESVVRGLGDGRFKTLLKQHCLRWRSVASAYAIENVVAHLAEDNDPANLFNTLTDPDFRQLKRNELGVNSLRSDLQRGLTYFSVTRPNLLCYLQVLFLEQSNDPAAPGTLSPAARHSREFSNFLQLDAPPERRRDVGIQHVLSRIFPFNLAEKQQPGAAGVRRTARVEFVEYELGSWHCKCKAISGHRRRFDYSCHCGASRGYGVLGEGTVLCPRCRRHPAYALCPACDTRVTLDLLWSIQEGALHPCQLKAPLNVTLQITGASGLQEMRRVKLMQLPIPLSLRERAGEIGFDIPSIFWMDEVQRDAFMPKGIGPQVVTLDESDEREGRAPLRTALEALLTQTLMPPGAGSLKSRLRATILNNKEPKFSTDYTKTFIDLFTAPFNGITNAFPHRSDLIRAVAIPLECLVADSPAVPHGSVLVNRDLRVPGALHTQYITNHNVVLKKHPHGEDTLTPEPPGRARPETLAGDGIVAVGTRVRAGDILVGVESPRPYDSLTPEEKLIASVFASGPFTNVPRDRSLILENYAGLVLGVNVLASKQWPRVDLRPEDGRFVKLDEEGLLALDELARINITVASDMPVEVGDTLYGEDGMEAVVCQIRSGSALAKMSRRADEPGLLVPAGHPWAATGSAGRPLSPVRVRLKSDLMLGSKVMVRGIGTYALINNKPSRTDIHEDAAQEVRAEDFEWLLARGAHDLAFELYGPRCDCKQWGAQLYEEAVHGRFRLADLPGREATPAGDLSNSASENVRYMSLLLRVLGIRLTLTQPKRIAPRLAFAPESGIPNGLDESRGRVSFPFTFDPLKRTWVPDGLFCERIFGPDNDYRCACGKFRRRRGDGFTCDKCGVELTVRSVRGQRLGYIKLGAPVVHPTFAPVVNGHLGAAYGLAPDDLRAVGRREKWLVVNDDSAAPKYTINTYDEAPPLGKQRGGLRLFWGAEAIQKLLASYTEHRPEDDEDAWLRHALTDVITVLPPERRPFIPTANGPFLTSDLNDFYGDIVAQANTHEKLTRLGAPGVMLDLSKALLQRDVDRLFDNRRAAEPLYGHQSHLLKSLVDSVTDLADTRATLLDGMLQRPVDFSARTHLVVGDTPSIDSALLPERLMWPLLQPFVYGELLRKGVPILSLAREEARARTERAYQSLRDGVRNAVVLISPNSSEWRLIAVRPYLTSDLAITIHPELIKLSQSIMQE